MIRWLLNLIHPSPKTRKPNVTGVHEAMGCLVAFTIIYRKGGKTGRFKEWGYLHYIDYDKKTKGFREFIDGHEVNQWLGRSPSEINRWFSHNRTADYTAADWYVLPEGK